MVAPPDCIWIVSPPGYIHSHCFDEVAFALSAAFKEIGIDVPVIRQLQEIKGRPLVLGPQLLADVPLTHLPKQMILYNLEQVYVGSPWIKPGYLKLLHSYPVWDYSVQNIATLQKLGISDVTLCPIGYHPSLTCIQATEETNDVLFFGSLNIRRKLMIEQLILYGFNVRVLFGIYGKERDNLIAQSKIILNMHYYPAKVLEIVRLSYLLANNRFIISERGGDQQSAQTYKEGLVFCNYGEIPETCMKFTNNAHLRSLIAKKGAEIFKQHRLTDTLQHILH